MFSFGRKLWERYIERCRDSNSLKGIIWSQLRSHLDALEMKKLYGLNPMAPEFVPIACGNVLRAGQPLIASTSYNYHSMYAPPPYLPPPVPSAAPVTNLFSNQQQQSWFMQQQQQQQHGSPRRQQQATTPLASLGQSRTAYRPNRSMIAHPPPLGGVAGGRTKSAQHFGVGGGISAPSPPSINFNSSFNSSSPFAHLNSVFQVSFGPFTCDAIFQCLVYLIPPFSV